MTTFNEVARESEPDKPKRCSCKYGKLVEAILVVLIAGIVCRHVHRPKPVNPEIDLKPLLDNGIFRELPNIGCFRCARIAHGTVEWPYEQDICPDTLYLYSEPITPTNAD